MFYHLGEWANNRSSLLCKWSVPRCSLSGNTFRISHQRWSVQLCQEELSYSTALPTAVLRVHLASESYIPVLAKIYNYWGAFLKALCCNPMTMQKWSEESPKVNERGWGERGVSMCGLGWAVTHLHKGRTGRHGEKRGRRKKRAPEHSDCWRSC